MDHYAEAEKLLRHLQTSHEDASWALAIATRAQAHAALAGVPSGTLLPRQDAAIGEELLAAANEGNPQ